VDQLRTLTLEGARARGWPEGDAVRLLTKINGIRERTANETTWHIDLFKAFCYHPIKFLLFQTSDISPSLPSLPPSQELFLRLGIDKIFCFLFC